MKWLQLFKAKSGRRFLRDFIRLAIGFTGCLFILGIYQQLRLYEQGILDGFINSNMLVLWMHHLGFASLAALCFAPVFNVLERYKAGWGFRFASIGFMLLLLNELYLTQYYLSNYEIPGWPIGDAYGSNRDGGILTLFLAGGSLLAFTYQFLYRQSKRVYRIIGRMFPITIILFSLFLATVFSEKQAVNVNKNYHLIAESLGAIYSTPEYTGSDPFPLWNPTADQHAFTALFNWEQTPPDVVIIAVEGLSADFVGNEAPYKRLMPFLDSLRTRSAFWPNTLANAMDSESAPALIAGSLPLGNDGFFEAKPLPRRRTLFGLMKASGYRTSFQFGGNSAIPGWDKMLYEERIDEIIDQKSFGTAYEKQEDDAAGISLGYPDHLLFQRFLETRANGAYPEFHYFQTLSSQKPFAIPNAADYEAEVSEFRNKTTLNSRQNRMLRQNEELAASLSYADNSLKNFISGLMEIPGYENSIIIITGTHRSRSLASENILDAHRVPLLVFSNTLKVPKEFPSTVSHAAIAPTIFGSLSEIYEFGQFDQSAWLSKGLMPDQRVGNKAMIPLYSGSSGIYAAFNSSIVTDGKKVWEQKHGKLLAQIKNENTVEEHSAKFDFLRAIEAYVVEEDAIIPKDMAIFDRLIAPPTPQEMIWIQSVFQGKDFDKAYRTARDYAISGDYKRARQLCRYILSEVPGHVDSEILLGRLHAWQKDYPKAMEILEQVIQKHPVYEDGYSALLDVYYWSGNKDKARYLKPVILQHLGNRTTLIEKLQRAETAQLDNTTTFGVNPVVTKNTYE